MIIYTAYGKARKSAFGVEQAKRWAVAEKGVTLLKGQKRFSAPGYFKGIGGLV